VNLLYFAAFFLKGGTPMKRLSSNPKRKMARTSLIFALALALFLVCGQQAQAVVLHDNFGAGDSFAIDGWGSGCVLFLGGCLFRVERATDFVPPAGDDYTIDSVAVALKWVYGPDYTLNLHIAADNAGQPGAILETKVATAPASARLPGPVVWGAATIRSGYPSLLISPESTLPSAPRKSSSVSAYKMESSSLFARSFVAVAGATTLPITLKEGTVYGSPLEFAV